MSAFSHKQKFGCRELSKTTSSCRDLAVEANASAVGSKSGQLSVSYFMVEGDSFLLSMRTARRGARLLWLLLVKRVNAICPLMAISGPN
jgi:hypothetical protein